MKTYPRYFIGSLWSDGDAYLRFDSPNQAVWIRSDGSEGGIEYWDADHPDKTWREVTESVAKARITPPASEPLRWVENTKPDKPGIWAVKGKARDYAHLATESDVADDREFSTGTWCYLGPIPEILPPKKKVVQRLWLLKVRDIARSNCAEYSEHWLGYDEQPTEDGNWIRTDKTREVEC